MGEAYPVTPDVDEVVTIAALQAVALHWQEYNAVPAEERLGDEDTWDTILPEVLVDIGIEQSRARELCALAKLDAQL